MGKGLTKKGKGLTKKGTGLEIQVSASASSRSPIERTFAELGQGDLALLLRDVTVEDLAVLANDLVQRQLVGLLLGVGEHDGAPVLARVDCSTATRD